MRLNGFRFEQFVLLSLLIHSGAYAVWLMTHSKESVVSKPVDSLTISVGLQAALAGASQSTPAIQQQAAIEPVEQILETEPAENEQLLDVKEQEHLTEEVVPLATAKPIETPKHKPKPIEPPQQKPPLPVSALPKVAATQQGNQGLDGAKANQLKQQDSGLAQQSGGSPSDEQFDYLIHQHLLKHKTAPKMLKSRRGRVVVKVEFTIDRQGKLLQYRLAEPSRIRELDRATIKLGRKASPFPKAPDYVSWQQRSFVVDVVYLLK